MSAWAELVNSDGSDEWLELCNAALAEVQREALWGAAEKIRRHGMLDEAYRPKWLRGHFDAADLIDPKVTS